jgi:putative CocE/NonD family hydrolase
MTLTGIGLDQVEDWEVGSLNHPLNDSYWRSRVADWSQIDVPTYAASEWGNNLHLRGTIEAWRQIASKHKYIDISGGKEWADFYSDWAFERQRAFLGEFLKGEDNGVASGWSPVRIAMRENGRDWQFRDEKAWPLARAEYRKLYLNAATGRLEYEAPGNESQTSYRSTDIGDAATFQVTFEKRTEITGNSKLKLWLSADLAADADVFVVYEKLDRNGQIVPFIYSQMSDDGPPAYGWLRASHRELDEARSTPERPYHKHERNLWLIHRVPVELDIEIWPTNIVFEAGESLRLIIRGTEYNIGEGSGFVLKHWPLRNDGHHIIHTGGFFESYLLLPFVVS